MPWNGHWYCLPCIVEILISCSLWCVSGLLSPHFLLYMLILKEKIIVLHIQPKVKVTVFGNEKKKVSVNSEQMATFGRMDWPCSWWLVSVHRMSLTVSCCKWYYRSRQEVSNSSEFRATTYKFIRTWLPVIWSIQGTF